MLKLRLPKNTDVFGDLLLLLLLFLTHSLPETFFCNNEVEKFSMESHFHQISGMKAVMCVWLSATRTTVFVVLPFSSIFMQSMSTTLPTKQEKVGFFLHL